MWKVEGHDTRVGPERRSLGTDRIRSARVFRIGLAEKRAIVRGAVRPPFVEVRLPGETVVEHFDLPDPAFLHVLVLVDPGLPPLLRDPGRAVGLARVASALQ